MFSRLAVGGLFIYASFYKIVDPESFAKTIWYYHIMPGKLINLVALIMPWLELLCGLGLIFGFLYRGSVLWVNALLVLFIAALTTTIVRGLNIECGCFKAGHEATDPAWQSLWIDLIFMVFAVQMLLSRSRLWMWRR
jgi:hypothetical protein